MKNMTRRDFLKSGGLLIAVAATPGALTLLNVSEGFAMGDSFKPNAYVEVAPDGMVTVWTGQTNLGQGTHTGMAMIVAEELDADWTKIQVQTALAGKAFHDPFWGAQFTGGSTSIRHRWDLIRNAAAAARAVLVEAAAQKWGVPAVQCKTKDGTVHGPGNKSLAYGKLVAKAATLPVPEKPALKDPKAYRVIGSQKQRMDIPDKVQGITRFGIDTVMDNMCIAVVARPPRYGAKPQAFDEKAARSVKGVIEVVPFGENRVAVCAENTYAAMQGREKLNITWSKGSHAGLDTDSVDKALWDALKKPGAVAQNNGDAKGAIAGAARKLEASYYVPYISHAQLEPTNCTSLVEEGRCRIWAPTQGQTTAQYVGAGVTGLPVEQIEVMTTPAGGGFGRRSEGDVIEDAVVLSKIMKRPVKVMWTREDDFTHDVYRPGSTCSIQAGLDKSGKVVAWSHKQASASIAARVMPDTIKEGVDHIALDGVVPMSYSFPNSHCEYVMVDLPIPVGFWRSVGNTINCFTVESFMDELAHLAGKDPLEFRLAHMEKGSRAHDVLTLLRERGWWDEPLAEGRGRGVALTTCFGSSVAQMMEVSVDRASGGVKVHRVAMAVDCGPAVYPDAITAQMEGGLIIGLSSALNEKVEFADGGVKTANYDEYPILTLADVPEIEVHIARSSHKIGGIGEPGVPSTAPALANAIFAATGVRLRELPIDRSKLKT